MGSISVNVPNSWRSSGRFIEMAGKKRQVGGAYIPERVLIVGQYLAAKTGVTAGAVVQCYTADEVGDTFGYGSELHRQAIKIFAALGGFNEYVYCVAVAPASGTPVAATGTITFVGASTSAGTDYYSIGGDLYEIGVASGATAVAQAAALVALITANVSSAVSAAVGGTGSDHIITLTCKQTGANGNQIAVVHNPAGISQSAKNPSGTAVTVPATGYLTSGAGNPSVSGVFLDGGNDKLGDTWYTLITCPYTDATALAVYKTAGAARRNPIVKRPFAALAGYVTELYAAYAAIPATINSPDIGTVWESRSLAPSYELAAAVLGMVAYGATLDPGRPYMTLPVNVAVRPNVANRLESEYNALFKAGGGYTRVDPSGGCVIGDLALTYRTQAGGAATEEWFDIVSMTRRQAKLYTIDQLLLASPYSRAILGSDDLVTSKDYVIKPKKLIADLFGLIDFWASEGWTKNPETVKDTVAAEINATNNSRLDAELTDDEAQALRIVAVKYAFLYD